MSNNRWAKTKTGMHRLRELLLDTRNTHYIRLWKDGNKEHFRNHTEADVVNRLVGGKHKLWSIKNANSYGEHWTGQLHRPPTATGLYTLWRSKQVNRLLQLWVMNAAAADSISRSVMSFSLPLINHLKFRLTRDNDGRKSRHCCVLHRLVYRHR